MKIEMNLMNLEASKIGEKSLQAESSKNVNFGANEVSMPEAKKLSGISITKVGLKDVNLARPAGFSRALTFTGNPSKNQKQIASIGAEYQNFFNDIYKVGGLGNVAGEASVAMKKHSGVDIRTFVPYYTQDNPDGKLKVKRMIPGETFENGEAAYKFEAVDGDYQLQEGEEFVVHMKQEEGKPAAHKVIEDTGVTGTVESINRYLTGVDQTPYRMFKAREAGPDNDQDLYLMYLPDTAKFPRAYGSEGAYSPNKGLGTANPEDNKTIFPDVAYANFDRAVMDAMPKMNNEKFGNYNPASLWLHDRHAFATAKHIFESSNDENSYWNGIRAHSTFHNPGRDYQGFYSDPADFLRIVGSKEDLEMLQESPAWGKILQISKKVEKTKDEKGPFDINDGVTLTATEVESLKKALEPAVGDFVDSLGTYNLCKIAVECVKADPDMFSAGTVSKYYGEEMKNPETEEIAYGLTDDFASIETIDIVNGSTPANMNLYEVGALGAKECVFAEKIKDGGFKPYPKLVKDEQGIVQNIDAVYDVKQSNKEWFINHVAEAAKEGPEALNKLFFTEKHIADGAEVLGGLSEFKEGDQLFISWGRSDKQKGFPTTIESFVQYFTDPSVPDDVKKHTKVLVSAIFDWGAQDKEYELIKEGIEKIQEAGYGDNLIYLHKGLFSNRIGMFADWAIITSEYEPCGITPLEAYASGTPVLSNKTGGSPDFITAYDGKNAEAATGFLTEHAYKVNPAVLGAAAETKGDALDAVRRKALGKENAVNIKQAMELSINNPEDYKKMSRNAISQKIDWHENNAFNDGKSANDRYLQDAWHITAA